MIKAERIGMEYATKIFEDITFILGDSEKVGLVGLNGCGKSTLIKIIAGIETPTKGEIHMVQEVVRYLPQNFHLETEYEYLGEFTESLVSDIHSEIWKVEKILSQLEFGEIDEFQRIETLSPGQKMKLYLSKLLVDEPTVLLLDEPTNHLDIVGIEHFERFIKNFKGICIVISHDRQFLNSVIEKVFEIDEGVLKIYDGDYDSFVLQKKQNLVEREKLLKAQERKKKRFEEAIEFISKQAASKEQGRRLRAMKTRMEREVLREKIDRYDKKEIKNLRFEGEVSRKKRILEVKDVSFSYTKDRMILDRLDLEIYGGEKIWLLGQNGVGKSTLIKLLVGELAPSDGVVNWGANINWRYFAQDETELNLATEASEDSSRSIKTGQNNQGNQRVHDYFLDQTGVSWNRSFGILDSFLFDEELRTRRLKSLSPGQKARLSFAILSQKDYQCLILDEPTNHLDIETKETIEKALKEFRGAVILISHDRYFAEAIEPTRTVTIEGGKLVYMK